MKMPIPKRGEIWLADLGFVAKTRPVLVLNKPFSDSDYTLINLFLILITPYIPLSHIQQARVVLHLKSHFLCPD